MPALDLKSIHWHALFDRESMDPLWPELLTDKYWQKNKGKLAKMAGSTGMGDALKQCEQAFKKVAEWPRVQGARSVDIEKNLRDIAALVKGDLKKLHEALKQARATAQATADSFSKNKLVPKGAVKLASEIRDACDVLFVCTNPSSLGGHVDRALKKHKADLADKQRRLAGPTVKAAQPVPKKVLKDVSAMKQILGKVTDEALETVQSTLASQVHSRARDMTQPIRNIMKCAEAGVEFQGYREQDYDTVYRRLLPYADSQSLSFSGQSRGQILEHVEAIGSSAQQLERMLKKLTLA